MAKYPVASFAKGSVIFEDGDAGDKAYVLKQGSVEIFKTVEGKKKVLDVIKPLSVFGEMVLFEGGGVRTTSAVALDNVMCLEINRKGFNEFLDESPEIMQVLLKLLVERLRKTTAKAVQLPQVFDSVANLLELFALNGCDGVPFEPVAQFVAQTFGVVRVYADTMFDSLVTMGLISLEGEGEARRVKFLVKKGLAAKALDKLSAATDSDGGSLPLL